MKQYILPLLIAAASLTGAAQAPQHIEERGIEQGESRSLTNGYDGIDVSKYQGDIDWAAIARNKRIKFAYIKATEGATYVDPRFEENIAEARRHGVKVGCYHFLRSSSSIDDQFENMKKHVRPGEQNLVPMIDVESMGKWSQKQLVDSLHEFAVKIYEYYKCAPIIYTYVNFYNRNLAGNFTNYPLFIARYKEPEPELSDGTRYVIWQYTERGRVDGINGNVDLSQFGNGYSLRDIMIKSQHIVGTTGIDIKPEDLVLDPSQIKEITPIKFKTEVDEDRAKELLELKRQQAAEEKRLRKEREKQAKKKAKEAQRQAEEQAKLQRMHAEYQQRQAEAIAAEAEAKAKEVIAKKAAEEEANDADGNSSSVKISTRQQNRQSGKQAIRYSTRKRNE